MATAGGSRVSSVFRPALFKGKAAIVTGGATGIGSAITKELLYLGCSVMIASRKLDSLTKAKETMQHLTPAGGPTRLEIQQCNIRKEEDVKSLVSSAISKFGQVDYLVNNGGGQFVSPAESITAKGWHAVIETNLYGTFYCCREAYNQWMKDHGGAIVNIIADMWKGMPGMSHSGAARAGVDNLTKTLAVEWASSGVRVNTVAPGSAFPSPTAAANYDPSLDTFDRQIPRIPAKRLGNLEEVSAAVCYLLSPAAAFVSGESIKVDGAHSLYSPSLPWPIKDHSNYPVYKWETDGLDQETQASPSPKAKL